MAITVAGMDGMLGVLDATAYLGVHTGAPGPSGATNELAGTRPAVTFGAASTFDTTGRQRANSDEVLFTTPGAGTYEAWSVWTAATGGTCRWVIPFAVNRTLTSVDDLRAAVGAIVCSVKPTT